MPSDSYHGNESVVILTTFSWLGARHIIILINSGTARDEKVDFEMTIFLSAIRHLILQTVTSECDIQA